MENARPVCPLLSLGRHLCGERAEQGVRCLGSRCAWWDARNYYEPGIGEGKGRCGVLALAQQGNCRQ